MLLSVLRALGWEIHVPGEVDQEVRGLARIGSWEVNITDVRDGLVVKGLRLASLELAKT